MQTVEKLVRIAALEGLNDRIIKDDNLNSYLNKYTKKELLRSMIFYHESNNKLADIFLLDMKKKKEVIEYYVNNQELIYSGLFEYMNKEYYQFFHKLVNKKGYVILNINDLDISIGFILFLHQNLLAAINFHKKEETIEIYIPIDILKVLSKIIKKKEIKLNNKNNNDLRNNINALLDTYGLIELDVLYNIYNKKFGNITKKELLSKIRLFGLLDENIQLYGEANLFLVCNISFDDEDDAFCFYYKREDGEYKIFDNKEDYYYISQGGYINKFEEIDKIVDILDTYGIDEETEDYFIDFILLDYISTNQRDNELADKNLMHNLNNSFKFLNITDKIILKKLIEKLSNEFPSWYYRGYSVNEIKVKIKNKINN